MKDDKYWEIIFDKKFKPTVDAVQVELNKHGYWNAYDATILVFNAIWRVYQEQEYLEKPDLGYDETKMIIMNNLIPTLFDRGSVAKIIMDTYLQKLSA